MLNEEGNSKWLWIFGAAAAVLVYSNSKKKTSSPATVR